MINLLIDKDLDKIIFARRFLPPVLTISSIFFLIGMVINLFFYVRNGKMFHVAVDGTTVFLLAAVWMLTRIKKFDANRGMIGHICIVTVNLCLTIAGEALNPDSGAEAIMGAVCISIIPVILSNMTSFPQLTLIVSGTVIGSYCIAGIALKNYTLLENAPSLTLVLAGASVALLYLFNLARRIERENITAEEEEARLFRFFKLTDRQWEMIKKGNLKPKQAGKILAKMEDSTREKIIYQLKKQVEDDGKAKRALLATHPNLTAGELDLACLIVAGKTVPEIVRMKQVKYSAVTVARSRLRTKIGLAKESSLRNYLESVVREHKEG
jgi:DNA-binding CsgD family transcriptional regulator